MTLTAEQQEQVEQIVAQMIAEYRAKPTQEKEDGLGLELANLPSEQREYVSTVLLRIVAAEASPRP